MIFFIRHGQDFTFVDAIDTEFFQNLRLDKMPYTGFSHDGDGDGFDDLNNEFRVRHTSNPAMKANIRWDTLERHYSASSGIFSDLCLIGSHDIHNHAAFEHGWQSALQEISARFSFVSGTDFSPSG